jgi:hypothetical protein
MSSASLERLFDELQDAIQDGALNGQKFLPLNIIDDTITGERLKVAFRSGFHFRCASLSDDIAQFARKVFAILVLIGEPIAIKDLWKQGLRDEHLPLVAAQTRGKLKAADGREFGAWKVAARASEFLDRQSLVDAPVFDDTGGHFSLSANCAMPFTDSDEVDGGTFGYVYKCELHRAHQRGLQVVYPMLSLPP